jgi:hypothetical protein
MRLEFNIYIKKFPKTDGSMLTLPPFSVSATDFMPKNHQ